MAIKNLADCLSDDPEPLGQFVERRTRLVALYEPLDLLAVELLCSAWFRSGW
ncbi:MAG: hypothetical protein JWO67_4914 [Streptosporangiaceae bacterium]|nr:hypothetical protein [Streptosporangiaceae bacterium]